MGSKLNLFSEKERCKLQVAGYKLQGTSCRLQITGWKQLETWNLKLGTLTLLIFLSVSCFSQSSSKKDTTVILISDLTVQLETTDAMNDLYNYQFDSAEVFFRDFKKKYRWHPLPYFLVGLAEWWKIMPNSRVRTYDEKFL